MLLRFDVPNTFDTLLDEWMAPSAAQVTKSFPALDVTETENEFVALVEMPGVKKEDVKLSLEKNMLTIEGQRKPYELPAEARILMNEMRVRDFARSIRIPDEVEAERITAELENGILRVVLPKGTNARVRTIAIK